MAKNVPQIVGEYRDPPQYEQAPFRADVSDPSIRPFISESQFNDPNFREPAGFLAKNDLVTDYMTQDLDRVAGSFGTAPQQVRTPDMGVGSFGGNAALYSAINKRTANQIKGDVDRLKKLQKLQSPAIREQELLNQFQLEFQDYSLETQKLIEEKKRAYQRRQARRQARAGIVGSVLGIGLGAVGAAVAGPAGAMAGYSVGSGVGQLAGGS